MASSCVASFGVIRRSPRLWLVRVPSATSKDSTVAALLLPAAASEPPAALFDCIVAWNSARCSS